LAATAIPRAQGDETALWQANVQRALLDRIRAQLPEASATTFNRPASPGETRTFESNLLPS